MRRDYALVNDRARRRRRHRHRPHCTGLCNVGAIHPRRCDSFILGSPTRREQGKTSIPQETINQRAGRAIRSPETRYVNLRVPDSSTDSRAIFQRPLVDGTLLVVIFFTQRRFSTLRIKGGRGEKEINNNLMYLWTREMKFFGSSVKGEPSPPSPAPKRGVVYFMIYWICHCVTTQRRTRTVG